MAEKFIKSTDIKVFPTAYRNGYDPGAKFYSEENIGNILNRLIDIHGVDKKDGFVVNPAGVINDLDVITFNLHGYWFSFTFKEADFANFKVAGAGKKIIAYIKLTTPAVDTDNKKLAYRVLETQDVNSSDNNLDTNENDPALSEFTGLKFVDTPQVTDNNSAQLVIAGYNSTTGTWNIPKTATLKLNTLNILDKSNADPTIAEALPKSIRDQFTTASITASVAMYARDLQVIPAQYSSNATIIGKLHPSFISSASPYLWYTDNYGNLYQGKQAFPISVNYASQVYGALITYYPNSSAGIRAVEADWPLAPGYRAFSYSSNLVGITQSSWFEYNKTKTKYENGTLTIEYID